MSRKVLANMQGAAALVKLHPALTNPPVAPPNKRGKTLTFSRGNFSVTERK